MLEKMRNGRLLLALISMMPVAALATPNVAGVSSTAGQDAYDGAMSSTDLGQSATVTGTAPSLGSLAGLHDGLGSPIGGDTNATLTNDAYLDGSAGFGSGPTLNLLASHPVVTYAFNTSAGGSTAGYNITRIVSDNGWHDHASFEDQDYTVAYSTVANPSIFLPLTTVAFNPFDPANDNANAGAQSFASQVTITDSTNVLASGVAALEFTFSAYLNGSNQEQAGQVIREIDVIGTPTPEPTTCGLMLAGLMGLKRTRRAV